MIPSREDRGGAGEARGVLEMGCLSAATSPPLFFLALRLLLSCTVKPVSEWIPLGEVERLLSLEEEDLLSSVEWPLLAAPRGGWSGPAGS